MLANVHVICFAASYSVALVLELSRLLFRSGIRGAVMFGFVGAGWVAHTAFLYYRAVDTAGAPLSSYRDWYLLAAWVLVVVYFYLACYHPKTHFGVFLLPLVLGLIATGALGADPNPFAREPASKIWGTIHGTSILLATVAVLFGFAAGLMYLGQAWRLKHRQPPLAALRLPSLEWLQRANSRAIVISALMLGMGVISGMILNLITYRRHTPMLPWNDPVVLGTLAMFLWLLMHALMSVFYQPVRQGRKVAYLTVASFLFLLIALALGLLLNTQHGGLRTDDRGAEEERGAKGEGRREREEESRAKGVERGNPNAELQFALRSPLALRPSPFVPPPGGTA